jgi:hypothetical protein
LPVAPIRDVMRSLTPSERIAEIYKSKPGKTNGGAFATLDTNGKLVWD